MATLYTADSAVFGKDAWLRGLYEQYEQTPGQFYNMLSPTDPERIDGRNTYFKIKKGDDLGHSVIQELGDFPEPRDPKHAEATLALSTQAHTIQISTHEYEMLSNMDAAAVPVVEYKMDEGLTQFARQVARQCLSDGTSILARCTTTGGSTTVNIQSSDGDSGSANQYDRDRFQWIAGNRALVDIVDSTTGAAIANGSGRAVTSISKSGNTFTIADGGGNVTTTSSHVVTPHGSVHPFSSGSFTSGEFPGVNAILSKSRTYLGINSASAGNEYWDAVVIGAEDRGGSAGQNKLISLNDMLVLVAEMAQFAEDGMEPTDGGGYCLFSNYGARNAAVEYLAGAVSYVNPTDDGAYSFGSKQATFGGLEWYIDIHYPHNVIDCLHKPSLKKIRPTNEIVPMFSFLPGPFMEIWHPMTAASGQGHAAGYRAYMYGQFGMMTYKPAAHGRLDDVKEQGVI